MSLMLSVRLLAQNVVVHEARGGSWYLFAKVFLSNAGLGEPAQGFIGVIFVDDSLMIGNDLVLAQAIYVPEG